MEFAAGTKTALVDGLIFSQGKLLNEKLLRVGSTLILCTDLRDIYRFILAYHFFMEPKTLMLSLIEWYNVRFEENLVEDKFVKIKKFLQSVKTVIQRRVLKIVEIWTRSCWQDFYEGEEGAELYKLLLAFIEYVESNPKIGLQSLLRTVRNQVCLVKHGVAVLI